MDFVGNVFLCICWCLFSSASCYHHLLLLYFLIRQKLYVIWYILFFGTCVEQLLVIWLVILFCWMLMEHLPDFYCFWFNHIPGFLENAYNRMHALYSNWGSGYYFRHLSTPILMIVLIISRGFQPQLFHFLFCNSVKSGTEILYAGFFNNKVWT